MKGRRPLRGPEPRSEPALGKALVHQHRVGVRPATGLAIDPKLRALIVHGYDDLSCPYFQSKMVAAQIPGTGGPDRLQVKVYPAGHVFYSRPDSQAALRRDVVALYGVG